MYNSLPLLKVKRMFVLPVIGIFPGMDTAINNFFIGNVFNYYQDVFKVEVKFVDGYYYYFIYSFEPITPPITGSYTLIAMKQCFCAVFQDADIDTARDNANDFLGSLAADGFDVMDITHTWNGIVHSFFVTYFLLFMSDSYYTPSL